VIFLLLLQILLYQSDLKTFKRSSIQVVKGESREASTGDFFEGMQLSQQMYSAGCISLKGTVRCKSLVIAFIRRRFHSLSGLLALKTRELKKIVRAKSNSLFVSLETVRVACFPHIDFLLPCECMSDPIFSAFKKSNQCVCARHSWEWVRSPTLQIYFHVLRKLFFHECC